MDRQKGAKIQEKGRNAVTLPRTMCHETRNSLKNSIPPSYKFTPIRDFPQDEFDQTMQRMRTISMNFSASGTMCSARDAKDLRS